MYSMYSSVARGGFFWVGVEGLRGPGQGVCGCYGWAEWAARKKGHLALVRGEVDGYSAELDGQSVQRHRLPLCSSPSLRPQWAQWLHDLQRSL